MRKHLRRIGVLLFLVALIPSCELLEDCKSCTLMVGSTPGSTATYCGTELADKEAAYEVIGGVASYYDCQ